MRWVAALILATGGILLGARALLSWRISRLLHDWAPAAVAEQSRGAYRLSVARVRLHPLLRRIGVDSVLFSTDSARNAQRDRPLTPVHLALYDCAVTGLDIAELLLTRGFTAASLGCGKGTLTVDARRHQLDSGTAAGARHTFLALQRGLTPPRYAPRVRVARVEFPHLALDFRLPPIRDRVTHLRLSRLHWRMLDLVIDPADTAAAARTLFSRAVELGANNFIAHLERGTDVRVGALRASLTDSTVDVRNVRFERGGSRPYRRDSITTVVDRIAVTGIDVGQFAHGEGVRARRVAIDGFRIAVTSDRRLPPNPARRRYRSPQQWVAGIEQSLAVDSVVIRSGTVSYREHHPGRREAGVLTFARIGATALDVRHVAGRRSRRDVMTLVARADLQHAGRLDARFRVPLDAPDFTMDFTGRLNAMPGAALNGFLEHVQPLRITNGRVAGISFEGSVRGGRARGTVTPVYTDLAISVTQRGGGVLANRGILGDAIRGIASLAANWKVRDRNPEAGHPPLVGAVSRDFVGDQTLPGFLWFALRDGLLAVVRK